MKIIKQILKAANQENVLVRLKDRTTGTVIHEYTLGRRYHLWILLALAVLLFIIKRVL